MPPPATLPVTHAAEPGEFQPEPRRVNNLTLLDGKVFLATTLAGDITPPGAPDVGLFFQDTRFSSHYELRVNQHRAVVLSASVRANQLAQIELTTPAAINRNSFELPENTVHIRREQVLDDGLFDRLRLENYHLQPVELELELRFAADFADVFEVRGLRRERRGLYATPQSSASSVVFRYHGLDQLDRRTVVEFAPAPDELTPRRACFRVKLLPRQAWVLEVRIAPLAGNDPPRSQRQRFDAVAKTRQSAFQAWSRQATVFESSDDVFNTCLATSASDFYALRIPFGDGAAVRGHAIAAGIPWFATPFGRDSLIASLQTLPLDPALAADTLRYLASYQGKKLDPRRDEAPGKILHEMRDGEMTRAGEMPFDPYYGSIDSTPLFLVALSEWYQWTGDRQLLHELMPAGRQALQWMETYGDTDGDGFLDYQRQSERGLANQGWKDSWDAILYRDGVLAAAPVALCEVQGYAYDARYRWARLLRLIGETAEAARVELEAQKLAEKFERTFWLPEENFYALALAGRNREKTNIPGQSTKYNAAGERQPVAVITSNPGHLLWSRIVAPERAALVAQRLMREDMFSGWGVRTLAASEPVFNPLSYHRGSVWPHDNALLGLGMALYGHSDACERIFTGLYQAAAHFRDLRLPELFVGVERRDWDAPVYYPVACSPQAWASGAWFMLLQGMLGLRPNAPQRELHIFNPRLPAWLDWLRLRNLRIGASQVSLEFSRHGDRTFCNVIEVQGEALMISVDFR